MSASGLKDIRLSFQTQFGLFVIETDPTMPEMLVLKLDFVDKHTQILGHYYQINDAITDVVQQKCGFSEWDTLPIPELPHRVFDITCWKSDTSVAA